MLTVISPVRMKASRAAGRSASWNAVEAKVELPPLVNWRAARVNAVCRSVSAWTT